MTLAREPVTLPSLSALPYLPVDRLHAIARGEELPDRVTGAALLADVSGFTALSDALAAQYGPQRGAEELTRHMNEVWGALLGEVDRFGGTVLGFSGDAITCWFADARDAVTAAARMQEALAAAVRVEGIALKVAVAAGAARRFRVGDPSIQVLDVVAGATLDRLAEAEHAAKRGEVVIDPAAASTLEGAVTRGEARAHAVVVARVTRPAEEKPWPALAPGAVKDADVKPWLLPAVFDRLASGHGEFLAELRPAVAVFVRFGGIDYDGDDAAGEKLDAFVRRVQHVLAGYEGTLVDITIGDKGSYLYAAFGAPTAHEDDAERALRAALELTEKDPALQIGISRGRTRVGPVGGPTRRAYAVTGNEVNVAARLMQAAKPGEVLVSSHVFDGVRARFATRSLGKRQVKGRAEPIEVVALEGLGEGTTVFEAHDLMIGRQRELMLVADKMEAAAKGAGQVVSIVAEAGMGKSRLLAEIVHLARAQGFTVCAGEAQAFGTMSTYLAWHGVWRAVFGVDPQSAPVATLEAALGRIDPALVPRLPLLGPALGVAIPDNELTKQFEAKLRKDSLEALLATCLRTRAAEGPLLLAIEDAHWMDALSLDLLESLGRAIAGMPVVLVTTARPHEKRATVSLPHFTELALRELPPDDAAALIARGARARFGDDARVPDAFIALLQARAEGNPFMVEELLGYLHDRGITPERAVTMDAVELPSSLSSAILGRIDRLTAAQQTLLKVASIIGRTVQRAWLWGVHPDLGTEDRVKQDLDVLARAELALPEGDAYVFKHQVIQEVAYESLPFATRSKLHEQLAGWLETKPDTASSLDLLAFHFGRSTNADKQREYFRKAGDAAAARYANDAAATYYERLVPLLTAAERAPILLSLAAVEQYMSRWHSAEQHCRSAIDLLEVHGPPTLRAQARLALAAIFVHRASYEDGHRLIAEARVCSVATREHRGEITALIESANVFRLQGRLDDALTALQETLTLSTKLGDKRLIARAYQVLGNVTLDKLDVAGARRWWTRSLELLRELDEKPGVAILLVNVAVAAFLSRDYALARTLLSEAQSLCRELGMMLASSRAAHLLAMTCAAQGELVEARALFSKNLVVLRDLGALRDVAELLVSFPAIWRLDDDPAAIARVVRAAGAGTALFDQLGSPVPPQVKAQMDRHIAEISSVIGPTVTQQAWTAGMTTSWRHAVADVLGETRRVAG